MDRTRMASLGLVLVAIGSCALAGAAFAQQRPAALQAAADDLYQRLRALEYAVPPVPATQDIAMGSWVAGGNFVGTASTCRITSSPVKGQVCTPPTVTINAISAILKFSVPNGVTLTANGRSVQSSNGQAIINVGNADVVDWTLTSGGSSKSDKLFISRPDVAGLGAFTIAALPISIIYEPPQNAARTNSANIQLTSESAVIDTITNGSSTTSTPTWAGGEAAIKAGKTLASITPQTSAAWSLINGAISALSSGPEVTDSVEVNTDHTLTVKITDSQMVMTRPHSGPGHGDLIAFYKDARVIWGMVAGKVTLTLLDHHGLSVLSVDQLRADIAALSTGGPTQSHLDADTLKSLIALDPMAGGNSPLKADTILSVPTLSASRFSKDKDSPLTINSTNLTRTFTHSISQSDKTSKLQTTITVTESHGGWLTLLGIGSQTGGKTTTKVSLGSSRTVSNTQTKSASYHLEAAPNETYAVEIYYDNIFGTFLLRTPGATIGPLQQAKPDKTLPGIASPAKTPATPAKKPPHGTVQFPPKPH